MKIIKLRQSYKFKMCFFGLLLEILNNLKITLIIILKFTYSKFVQDIFKFNLNVESLIKI